jgi:hypothetical protein
MDRDTVETWNGYDYGKFKSANFFSEHLPLSAEQLLPFVDFRDTAQSRGLPKPHIQFHAGDPATRLQDTNPPSSAVAWRGASYMLQYYIQLGDQALFTDQVVPFMQEMEQVLATITAPSAYNRTVRQGSLLNVTAYKYTNYLDIESAIADPKVYFDDPTSDSASPDVWARLTSIKSQYDSTNVFSVVGGIPLATAASTATAISSSVTLLPSVTASTTGSALPFSTSVSATDSRPSAANQLSSSRLLIFIAVFVVFIVAF